MMFRKAMFPAMSLALMAGMALFGSAPVVAAEKSAKDPVIAAASKNKASSELLLKLSDDGYAAMRAVKAARIAIFNGKPDLAKKMVKVASRFLKATSKDDTKYAIKTKMAESGTSSINLVPIDGSLFVDDNFNMTPEKKAKIAKANEHLKKGESKKAIETLRLASIDVAFQRILMPVGSTTEHVNAAADLLGKEKYYEANLALKAAEDGLIIDTVALAEPATKGKK